MNFFGRYKKAVVDYCGESRTGLRYDPDPEKVIAVIRESLTEPRQINEVVWKCLAESDSRIKRSVCCKVYDHYSWEWDEDTRKLKQVFESLLSPPGPINWDDYL